MSTSLGMQAVKILASYINLPEYLKLKISALTKNKHTYTHPKWYWSDVLDGRIEIGDVVRLEHIVLTEWFPRVPGLAPKIFDAPQNLDKWKRDRIRTNTFAYRDDYYVLQPKDKTKLVLAGLGTMRFSPHPEGRLLGACAEIYDENCADAAWGVPILLKTQPYDKISAHLSKGIAATVEGVYSRIPGSLSHKLWSGKGIPRTCLLVDSQMLIDVHREWLGKIICYPWVLYEYSSTQIDYAFAFASCNGTDPKSLTKACDLIEDYVGAQKGSILTDFDEEVPRFEAQVQLGDLMNNLIDMKRLNEMISKIRSEIKENGARTQLVGLDLSLMPRPFLM